MNAIVLKRTLHQAWFLWSKIADILFRMEPAKVKVGYINDDNE